MVMKQYYLVALITTLLVISLIILFDGKSKRLESRINVGVELLRGIATIDAKDSLRLFKLDSLTNEIIKLKTEKENSIQILDRESNRLILLVTVLFGLFGVVGYSVFRYEISSFTQKLEKYIIDQNHSNDLREEREKIIHHYTYLGLGNIYSLAGSLYHNENVCYELNYTMMATKYLFKSYSYNQNAGKIKTIAINNLLNALNVIDYILTINVEIKLDEIAYSDFQSNIAVLDEVSKFDDDKVKEICAEIRFKFIKVQNLISRIS